MPEKKKPKIKVLDWPAIPVLTPEEVYGITAEEKEIIERKIKKKGAEGPGTKGT